MHQFLTTFRKNIAIFSSIKQVGGSSFVPQLPSFLINPDALRPASRNDKDLTLDEYQSIAGLRRSYKQIPQCRYYAVEYKNRIYHIFNAYCYPVGRMINKIATSIRGKNSPLYKNSVANVKNGDICVIVNAMDPLFTGKKLKFKNLKYHTNFIGNLKTFSYRSILNKKPQLLYYYLLRKAMPKNKLSEKYLQNLKIYRGPNHDIKGLPQFMPPKSMKTPLAHIDINQYIKQQPLESIKILQETQQGLAQEIFGRKFESMKEPKPDENLDIDGKYDQKPEKRTISAHGQKNVNKMIRRQKTILDRYRQVRAPYRNKQKHQKDYIYFRDERKAKKSPYYEEMANQDLVQEDDFKIDDPLLRKGWDKQDKSD